MSYRIFETDGFRDDLQQDFGGRQQKILKKLRNYVYPQLSAQPRLGRNVRKLIEYSPETWRYRIGEKSKVGQSDQQLEVTTLSNDTEYNQVEQMASRIQMNPARKRK